MAAGTSEPRFALFTAETWADPWPLYAALRARDPVHHVVPEHRPDDDYYVLTRHADIWSAVADHETFTSTRGLTVDYRELEKIGLQDNPPMVMQDPPQHTAFRKLVARAFTPAHVRRLEPEVREFVVERVERLRATGGGDIVAELFKPLPSLVVAHFLGVPRRDRDRFDRWTEAIVGTHPDAGAATVEMMTYFTGLIERRRTDPGTDIISHLVGCGLADDDHPGGLFSILAFAFTMVTGGNDTVTGMLGGAVQLLHRRPDQRRLLTADPALLPDAVEELLRLTSPAQMTARTATRDVTVGDTVIPAGRKALMVYASGNRDERRFGPDAEELDVARRPRQILTFGYGAHHCIGNQAARMQSRVALEELLARCPEFAVDESGITWADGSNVRRPTAVPFTASG